MNGPSEPNLRDTGEYLDGYNKNLFTDFGFFYNEAWKAKSPEGDSDYTSWNKDWNIAKEFKMYSEDESYIAFWIYNGNLYQLEWFDRTGIIDNEIHVWRFYDISDIYDGEIPSKVVQVIPSTASKLRANIANWYNVLKEVALVSLLSILVYIAIRMIISSAAKDKVKYKKMFQGWFEAICILLVLHFLISATFIGVQAITDVFAKTIEGPSGDNEDKLMTDIRNDIEKAKSGEDYGDAFFNILLYLVLFSYTLSFGVQYLKRVVYVAFLILISPLIALTYPLDKINDGKAQAFEVWLKEFLFNVLIQPLHLLIYYLLIVTAKDLVETNKLYALVAVGSLLPVEKFVRKMFGLESNSSMGSMSSALGGAAIMNSMNKLGSGGGKSKGGSKGGSTPSKPNNVRTANEGVGDPYEALRSGGGSPGAGGGPAPGTASRKHS